MKRFLLFVAAVALLASTASAGLFFRRCGGQRRQPVRAAVQFVRHPFQTVHNARHHSGCAGTAAAKQTVAATPQAPRACYWTLQGGRWVQVCPTR